jgi:PAS domain-containing protein
MVDLVVPEGFTFALEDMSTGPRLYGMSWRTRAPFICNDPSTSPHSRGGVPSGHPDIDHYMEVPIFWGDRIIGLLALANRPGGFEPHHAAWLQGFLSMLATLMQLYECVPPQSTSTSPSSSSSSSSTPATTPASPSTSKSTTPRGKAETPLQEEPSQSGRAAQSYHFHPQPLGVADFDAREISHAVLDSIGEGVVVLDAKLRLRHVNNGAVRMLGYTSGRALLSRCRHLRCLSHLHTTHSCRVTPHTHHRTHASDRTLTISRSLGRVVSDVIPYYDEERAMDWSRFSDGVQQKMLGAHVATHARSMGGGLLSIDLSLSSFIFQRKRYFSAVFSDISQKKKSVERNKFLAFLSHEIRNPLQV